MGLFSKITRSVTKPLKKVLKSPLGKIGLGLAAYKFGPSFLSGKGFGMGDVSKWGNLKWLGGGANVNPMRLAALTGLGSLAGSGMVEEEDEETMDIDTGDGQKYYLRARQYFPEFRDDTPLFASQGGRVKANTGMYTGDMAGRALGQGLGSMNPMNPMNPQAMAQGRSPHTMAAGRSQDPRVMNQQQAMMQPQGAVPKATEDNELIQLIKMLSAMGIPMEQLRGRTKEELVEMAVQISGKGKETMEATEEVVQANTGGLMRTGYAMGTSQFGLMGNEHPIIPDKDGPQLDMRETGGYQPHGKAEKHDDVRALLAQGEFVMTSDAVKGMGGGDREKGAQKMYELMHNMEAMA